MLKYWEVWNMNEIIKNGIVMYVRMNYLINIKMVWVRGLLLRGVWGKDEVRIKVKRTQDHQNAAAKDFIPYHF